MTTGASAGPPSKYAMLRRLSVCTCWIGSNRGSDAVFDKVVLLALGGVLVTVDSAVTPVAGNTTPKGRRHKIQRHG